MTKRPESRSARPRKRAARAAAAAGAALLATVIGLGAAPAAVSAQSPEANLQTTVLKITGRTFSAGATIPVGTALNPVTLTTVDPDSGPQGVLGLNVDPFNLGRGEAATFRIGGTTVATKVPDAFRLSLQTNQGTITVLAFVAGRDTYILPRTNQPIDGITSVTGRSKLTTAAVSNIVTHAYGLFPEGAEARAGRVLAQSTYGGPTTVSVGDWLLYDADDVRGNADSIGDEVAIRDRRGEVPTESTVRLLLERGQEVTAFAQLGDGRVVALAAVRIVSSSPYGPTVSHYLFDEAGLSQAGVAITDVSQVVATAPVDHALTWSQLGF